MAAWEAGVTAKCSVCVRQSERERERKEREGEWEAEPGRGKGIVAFLNGGFPPPVSQTRHVTQSGTQTEGRRQPVEEGQWGRGAGS